MSTKPKTLGPKYIEFTIENGGAVAIKPVGFTDGSCQAATQPYEQALGKVTAKKITGPDCRQQERAR